MRRRCPTARGAARAPRTAFAALLAAAMLAAVGGCGQRGPLVLPDDAAARARAGAGAAGAAAGAAESGAGTAAGNAPARDDEGNERGRDER